MPMSAHSSDRMAQLPAFSEPFQGPNPPLLTPQQHTSTTPHDHVLPFFLLY
ncbi:hypothetical protein HanRHA438_Chr06g0264051 [Helianthus annuus]|nr:hypothetical protein HanRHA438_Chr06g0264051 [Helianthus annuus]